MFVKKINYIKYTRQRNSASWTCRHFRMIFARFAHHVTISALEDFDWRTHIIQTHRTFKVFVENPEIQKWNDTPLIRRDRNFYFFVALYFALLDLLPCLQARGIAIRALSEVGQNKVLVFFHSKDLLENLQVLLESDIFF